MKFIARSLLILLGLYGIAFAVGDAYLTDANAPLWWALAFAVAVVGLQYLASPLLIGRVMDIDWIAHTELPEPNRTFLEKLCAERAIAPPRLGIIYSGTPNAFSFGYTPRNARVVITRGLLDLLTPEEVNAVLAHEIGHVEHWDFVVMTIAALPPLLLYQIYTFSRNSGNHARLVAWTAYLGYMVTQFVVFLLNRTREYFADHYSAVATGTPNALSSALVKIACGMVQSNGDFELKGETAAARRREERRHARLSGAMALLGICNLKSGSAFILGSANSAETARVMRWELVNPWARLYEMSSTHPLTSRRIQAMNRDAEAMHQSEAYPLPPEQLKKWRDCAAEVVVWAAPWACVGAVLLWVSLPLLGLRVPTLPPEVEPLLWITGGFAWLVRIWYRYHGECAPATIQDLLEDTDVSQMRTRPVQLEGEILGRGVPGAFWSADLVLRDTSGILFVLNRRTVPFARLLFALTALQKYIGKKVVIEGWYRRGMVPYVEMGSICSEDGNTSRSPSRWIQYGLATLLIAAGYWWLHLRLNHIPL